MNDDGLSWADHMIGPLAQSSIDAKAPKKRRILVVDDNDEIHNDFRKILCPPADTSDLDDMEAFLFGAAPAAQPDANFEVSSAHQGAEALSMVQQANAAGAPYMLIFVDVRMPPGWDGVETLSRIWAEDPDIQSIICSAYLDYSWHDIITRFPGTDRLLILKKPFDPMEVRQMAYALTEKWNQSEDAKRAARALRDSEAKHRALLDAIPDTILRVGRDGSCLDAKAGSAPAPFMQAAELAGMNVGAALPTDIARPLLEHVRQAIDTGVHRIFEHSLSIDGDLYNFELRVVSAAEEEALVLVRDVTDRTRAEAEEEERRRKDETIESQARALSVLSAPIIPIHKDIVIMPLIGELTAERARHIHVKLLHGVAERRARVAILDVTGLSSLLPDVVDEILRAARSVRMLGSQVILTGVHPALAQALVNMDTNLSDITALSDLESGIAHAMKRR